MTNGNPCDKIQITKNDKCVRKGRYYEKTKLFCNDNLNTCKGGIRAYNRLLYICSEQSQQVIYIFHIVDSYKCD